MAQVRSAFALAALGADGESTIASPAGYRDHTERWLETMGLGKKESASTFRIYPGSVPPYHYEIPGDPSSAAFLWAAAAIVDGAQVVTPNISLNPGRIGFLEVLEAMGATVVGQVTGAVLGDPVGTVAVQGSGLRGTTVSGALAAAALDELPLVAVVASYAEGVTRVTDAGELRAKESDRIASTVDLVNALGGGAQAREDGFEVAQSAVLLDLGDDQRPAVDATLEVGDIVGALHERKTDVVDVVFECELRIGEVLRGERGRTHFHTGQVHFQLGRLIGIQVAQAEVYHAGIIFGSRKVDLGNLLSIECVAGLAFKAGFQQIGILVHLVQVKDMVGWGQQHLVHFG